VSAGFGEAGSVSVTVMALDWARTELSPLDAIRVLVQLRRHGLKVMTSTPASRSSRHRTLPRRYSTRSARRCHQG